MGQLIAVILNIMVMLLVPLGLLQVHTVVQARNELLEVSSAGNDSVTGGAGNDTIAGGAGRDTIDGGAGDDRITGGDGDDNITGGAGNDIIEGGAGNDRISTGAGGGVAYGGPGDDTFVTTPGVVDRFFGGSGADRVVGTVEPGDVIDLNGPDSAP